MKNCVCCMLLLIAVVISGCQEDALSYITYTGTVVEQNSMTPLSGLHIKITDDTNIYSEAVTDAAGRFSIDMAHNSSIGQVYLYIDGDELYPSKKIDLVESRNVKYDYGLIYLYDQTDESLYPKIESVFWDYPNDNKSMRFKDISIFSVCTLQDAYVEIATSSSLEESKKCPLELQTNGKYSCVVTNLTAGEKYYFQIVATNAIGTGRSDLYYRTFGCAIPEILGVKSATVESAVISIKISEEPLVTLQSGICWSLNNNPTINDNYAYAGSDLTADVTMSGVDFSKYSYYVRAFSTNANGVSYSETVELPVNNPYNLPTFESDGCIYTYQYMGKDSWQKAYDACEGLVVVFDDWTLPDMWIAGDLIGAYYMQYGQMPPLPLWAMRRYAYQEDGEAETYLMTTNGMVMWSKRESHHYFAIRKL